MIFRGNISMELMGNAVSATGAESGIGRAERCVCFIGSVADADVAATVGPINAGLLGLARNVALVYARKGITCNTVLPGMIGAKRVPGSP